MQIDFTFPVETKLETRLESDNITVTETAARKIISQTVEREKHSSSIRIGVKGSGCNGLSYVLEFVDLVEESDLCFESNDVSVYVDLKSFEYLKGLEIDFMEDGFKQGYEFKNPNQSSACGCGESFNI